MKVLGLDPSLTGFGWAIHDTAATGKARCAARGRFATTPRQLFISRYMQQRERLRALLQQQHHDKVALEFPIFNDLYSEGMYGLFLFTCEALYEEKQDVVFFANGQIKSHAAESLGRPKGWKMGKSDMIEAAQVDTGDHRAWNHNEADGYLCAVLGARFWSLQAGAIEAGDLTAVEKRTFTLIHKFQRGKRAGQSQVRGILHREDERFFRWSKRDGEIG